MAVTLTYLGSSVSTSTATVYTFSGAPPPGTGTAAADRINVAAAYFASTTTTTATLSSSSINGQSCTIHVNVNADSSEAGCASISSALNTEGTTGDWVFTWGASVPGCICYRYDMKGADATPTATASDSTLSGAALAASLAIDTDGCGIGVVAWWLDGTMTTSWTNLTENADNVWDTETMASVASSTSAGTSTRTATGSATPDAGNLALCAWGPAATLIIAPQFYHHRHHNLAG